MVLPKNVKEKKDIYADVTSKKQKVTTAAFQLFYLFKFYVIFCNKN